MNEVKRLSKRNELIDEMLRNSSKLKSFYHFTSINPHITLHTACQVIINRSDLEICHSFEEWNEIGRRINRGAKGIPYYDTNGYKRYLFDSSDTNGKEEFTRYYYPLERLLIGLDEINNTSLINDERSDYRKIHKGIKTYLKNDNYLSNDLTRNKLLIEGISYILYSKTDKPIQDNIYINPLPYSLNENANLFKEIYFKAHEIQKDIEEAYLSSLEKEDEIKVDEIHEEFIDDFEQESFDEEIEQNDINEETENEEVLVKEEHSSNKSKSKQTGIKDRKKKELTLFDVSSEKTKEEKLIEWGIKHGSGFVDGRLRIYYEYHKNPTLSDFAKFIKDEYGIGGMSDSTHNLWNDSKGLYLENKDKEHEDANAKVFLKWNEVAVHVADLIDEDNYLTAEEKNRLNMFIFIKENPDINEKIKSLVEEKIEEAVDNTTSLSWVTYFDEFGEDEDFVRKHLDLYLYHLEDSIKVADVEVKEDGIDVVYYGDYCKNVEIIDEEEIENDVEEEYVEISEVEEIVEDEELGGLKQRFKNNIEAIKLSNRLYEENRNPTAEERKVLLKYVGFGGLAQAFDEFNEKWKNEYIELKSLLSDVDYERAKGSVLNAHFTSREVIEGIYKALEKFGVEGSNKVLESSMGTGNFFRFMPKRISDDSKLYGVELDNITGRIAKKLYPNVNIQIKGFEDTTFPNNHFDLVVGNVPFGGYSVYDKDYNKYNLLIHDYFIAKSVDKVRPGGIVAVITSKGTMDKQSQNARKYIADRAELIGAIRLPNTAFKKLAGTEAVADILFLKKRDTPINATLENTEWLGVSKDEFGYELNNYFINHKEMILGTLKEDFGLYGAIDLTVIPDGREISKALDDAVKLLPQDIFEKSINDELIETSDKRIEVDYDLKNLCFKVVDNKLYQRVNDEMEEVEIPKTPKDALIRITKMIELRKSLRNILDLQISGCSDEVLATEQVELNQKYDEFVKKYGFLNSSINSKLFKDDGDSSLLFASEFISSDKKTATKADIYFKRTIRPYTKITSTNDSFEALQISKNELGRVDISYIESLTKKDYDTIIKELGSSIFRDPELVDIDDKYSGFVTSEEYLSGNVKKKLITAFNYKNSYPNFGFEKNVKALEEVQPPPLKATEIAVRLGASWIDTKIYKDFLVETLDIPYYYASGIDVFYNKHDSSYRVDLTANYVRGFRSQKISSLSTSRASVFRLFEDSLNLKSTSIYDTIEVDGKEKRVLNKEETIAAREKQNRIKDMFKEWIFKDPERRDMLEETYNNLFNQIRLPTYNGSYLRFPEMNPTITLKDHQKDAVHRIITSGNTLLHHVVGAGKTYTICAAAMKLRQYGLAKKPMIAVPNHLVRQWANEFRTLYPNANLLIATKEDLEKTNREKFVSKVALGDWDAVIIAQSSFAKIPISTERQIRKIKEEISKIEASIRNGWETDGVPRGAIKNLERIKKSRETSLKKLLDEGKKDSVLIFENLGVDYLFIDEAHFYKNLFLYTKMNNVSGISTAASQRATDLQLKCEYINELHKGDKGIVFATGTPISNSMTEMYTMQTYLQPRTLQELGITYFDGWAADFGETITSLEMSPSGQGYRAKTRFAKFTNLPELLTLYRSFADVKTKDMIKLDVPNQVRNVITLKPSENIIELAEEIADRAEAISGGGVDPHIDNMLKVTSDGKKLALDPRCFDPNAVDEMGSKLNECAYRVSEVYKKTNHFKGTQLIFCDLSTPKCAFDDYEYGKDFDVYNDLKYKLTILGIPKEEIAYIHEANSDLQKQALFSKVNEGEIRVLIGSTEKCGAGTNVQKRLIALHHLDTPYRPSDMEQREGRIIRQGNQNSEVEIYTYVTERTFDSYSYQILENKQRFISQVNNGNLTIREADDIDEATLTFAEIKAITAANPKIKRKMELDTEIARLKVLEGQYKKNLYLLQDKIRRDLPLAIIKQELYLENLKKDISLLNSLYKPDSEEFLINVKGINYTDKKEGTKALGDALMVAKDDEVIAEYNGFKISLNPIILLTQERSITLSASGRYTMDIGTSSIGNMTRLDNFFKEFSLREDRVERKLEQLKKDLEDAKVQVDMPFEHKEKLEELQIELNEINAELDLNKSDDVVISEDENNNYRGVIIEDIKESEIIEPFDKVASLRVNILPSYEVSQDEMNKYGYSWNGMLPIKFNSVDVMRKLGLDVYKLYSNDTESKLDDDSDKESHDGLFGIEKPEWIEFLKSNEAKDYFNTRLDFITTSSEVVNEMLDYMEEDHTKFLDVNANEKEYIKRFILPLGESSSDDKKRFGKVLADEFSKRIEDSFGKGVILQFGFSNEEIRNELISNLDNEELKAYLSKNNFYKEMVSHKVINEYEEFRKEVLSKGNDEAFKESYKIHFFTELKDFLTSEENNLDDKEYEMLFRENVPILSSLFDYYLKEEYSSIENYSEINNLVVSYNEKYNKNLVKEEENIMQENHEVESEKKNWLKINVPTSALIRKYDNHSFLRMPTSHEEYGGYTYNMFNSRIKQGRMITDLQSDSRELCLELIVEENEQIILRNGDKEKIVTGLEFEKLVRGTLDKDYEIPKSYNEMVTLSVPVESRIGKYESSSLFVLPNYSKYKGQDFYIPNRFVEDDKLKDGRLKISLPDNFSISVKNRETNEITKITPFDLIEEMDSSNIDDYRKSNTNWNVVSVNKEARLGVYEESSLFKMPNGSYQGFCYYLPNKLIKDTSDTHLRINLQDDMEITLKNKSNEQIILKVDEFISEVGGKDLKDYESGLVRPSSVTNNLFLDREKVLRANVPEEMKKMPNWVVVRTRENETKGRLDKFLIDVHTGKFARSDDPTTWTTFDEACKYARENNCETLAYALVGKNGICCIDLDKCITKDGSYSPLTKEVIFASDNTYAETSISGNGVHLFGKTDGMDLRTFSRNGDLEFYQKSHFIAMTGDLINEESKSLRNFDQLPIKKILEATCDKRTPFMGCGQGVEGLSLMSDRDVVEKAINSKHGETFKALYEGQDLQNNHSNSDMSLMNRLAFWCNGDKEQMIRIFATSGLFRPGKSPDYYESTAIKAIRDTTERFRPTKTEAPKVVKPSGSFFGKGS